MGLIGKIKRKACTFYRQAIVCDQYPMLTTISRKEWQEKGAIGLVFMLHHITKKDPNGIPSNEDLKVSPYFLEKIIIKYKKKGFVFISLDQLFTIILSDESPKRPFICFTIDDGYLDNYTNALPVFEKYNVPFAIFVATDFIERKAILWWDILEELVQQNNYVHFNDETFFCLSFQDKWNTFRTIRERILKFDQNKLLESLENSFFQYSIDWFLPIQEKAMSWNHIRELSKNPLCTIGGHTTTHPALNKLSKSEIHQEVSANISKLKEVTGKKINHFAFPYGSSNEIGEREYQLIKEFNFRTAFIAYGGCITNENKYDITHLPRVYLHERYI